MTCSSNTLVVSLILTILCAGGLAWGEEAGDAGGGELARIEEAGDAGEGELDLSGSFSLGATFPLVSGDEQKFREDHGIWDGFNGGLRSLDARLLKEDWQVTFGGRALYPGDYGANLGLLKPDFGFFKFEVDQFRSYYDSSNYFYPFAPFTYELDKDLYTTRRTTGLTLGWTPPNSPSVTLRFERWDKYGDASTLWGGQVTDGTQTWYRYP